MEVFKGVLVRVGVAVLVNVLVTVGVWVKVEVVVQTTVMAMVLLVAGPPPLQEAVPWSLTTWQESEALKL